METKEQSRYDDVTAAQEEHDDGSAAGVRKVASRPDVAATGATVVAMESAGTTFAVPTIAPVRAHVPHSTDLQGWLDVVEAGKWTGVPEEDIVEAYDHFRAVGTAIVRKIGGKANTPEYEIAFALRRQLAKAALAYVHHYIPFDGGPRGSEYDSARITALEHMRAAIDEPSSKRGANLRFHFRTVARFISKGALELEFGRKGNKWRDPKRRLSVESDPSTVEGAPDDGEDGAGDPAVFLDRMGLRRTLDLQIALTSAISELPDLDHQLIVLWSYLGYTASQLAPIFFCSEPTIAARLHALAQSPQLKPFRK